jgi:guanylate kinase
MLVIFFGVSCVGKSKLIRELVDNFHWISIPTYMTRALRDGEIEKISISSEEFSQMDKDGYFICVNDFFNGKYGTPRREIETAINATNQIWVLDFSISKRHLLNDYKHIEFVILPENEAQLIRQIKNAGRTDREKDILKEYKDFCCRMENESNSDFLITNFPDNVSATSQRINHIVNNLNHEHS